MIEFLKWDSDFFGSKIGRYNYLSDTESFPEDENFKIYDLVYIFSNKPIPSLFNCLMDIKVFYEKLTVEKPKSNNLSAFDPNLHSFNQLLELVYLSGHESRFLKDPFFGVKDFEKMYKKWIEKSLEDQLSQVLVYAERDNLIGFVSFSNGQSINKIDLIAVKKSHQGKGIGALLIDGVENRLGIKKKIRVPTQQSNLGACKFYNNQGFNKVETRYIYHYAPNPL